MKGQIELLMNLSRWSGRYSLTVRLRKRNGIQTARSDLQQDDRERKSFVARSSIMSTMISTFKSRDLGGWTQNPDDWT